MRDNLFNWQQKGWPKFTFSRNALKEELAAFAKAFKEAQKALAEPQDPLYVAQTLTAEAVTTSAIEGVEVDADVVMSSICRALGVAYAPHGVRRDARSEGVAQMMLSVRDDWDAPISSALMRKWHGELMAGDQRDVHAGAFRAVPVRVVAINALGESETRFEAPPPERVAEEISRFANHWRRRPATPEGVALKAAFIHPHFESIHPFEDGERGAKAGFSAAKWMRMTKVSKPTATRDIAELEKTGAIIARGAGPSTSYYLSNVAFELVIQANEPIDDPINDPIKRAVIKHVSASPGINRERLALKLGKSVETVKRAIAALVAAGRIEHRGSRKTGGYWVIDN